MKKGFTLIELLSVIAILAIIILIATPKIVDILNFVKTNSNTNQYLMIEKAGELYLSNQISEKKELGDYIFIEDIISNGYLEDIPLDFKTQKPLNGVLKIVKENGAKTLEYLEVNHYSGEVIKVDQNRTIKSIIIEGNTVQDETSTQTNMIPNQYEDWELGHYSMTTGLRENYSNRIRVPFYIDIIPSTSYYFNMNGSDADFIIRSYDSDFNFIRSRGTKNEGKLDSLSDEEYFSVSMYKLLQEDYQDYFTRKKIQPFMSLYSEEHEFREFVPNSPSAYFPSDLNSVKGNLIIDDNIFSIPDLKGLDSYRDIFNPLTGEHIIKVAIKEFDGTENWYDDNGGLFYYTNYFSSANTTLPIWKVSNAKYKTKDSNIAEEEFYLTSSGANYFEYSKYNFDTNIDFKNYILENYNKGKPIEVFYPLEENQIETLSSISLPPTPKYLYLDSNVKGNIIVTYN